MKVLPSKQHLNTLFSYNPHTGKLMWKVSPAYQIKEGTEAGWFDNMGYRIVMVDGQPYRVARVIWKMTTGFEPNNIDHINGMKSDNRLKNLRSVDHLENHKNRPIQSNNKSGIIGVSRYKRNGKWVAQIVQNGKKKNLGYFDRKEDAVKCRKQAELENGYHKNHGRFV